MWSKEQILRVLTRKSVLVGVASVASASAGVIAGYRVADTRLTTKYEQLAEQEIESARQFYQQLHKTSPSTGKPMTPQEVAAERIPEEAMEALRGYKGEALIREETVEEEVVVETSDSPTTNVTVNVFTSKDDDDLPDGHSG